MERSLCGLLAALAVVGLTTGCAQVRSGPPVADSTLVAVLVDLHLLEGRASASLPDSIRADSTFAVDRSEILRRHGVDSATFARTLDYYRDRLPAYRRIYDRVIDRLQAGQPAPRGASDRSP